MFFMFIGYGMGLDPIYPTQLLSTFKSFPCTSTPSVPSARTLRRPERRPRLRGQLEERTMIC